MGTDYFCDQGLAAVTARVAIQLVKMARRDPVVRGLKTSQQPVAAVLGLEGIGLPFVRMALHSLAVHIELGYSSKDWLAGVIYRDLMGYSFRRCYFAAYKETRRLYPRVTNRGVQVPLFDAGLPVDTGETTDVKASDNDRQGDSGSRLDHRHAAKRRTRLSDLDR